MDKRIEQVIERRETGGWLAAAYRMLVIASMSDQWDNDQRVALSGIKKQLLEVLDNLTGATKQIEQEIDNDLPTA